MELVKLGVNYFGILDYIFLAGTLLISLLIGLYYGYKSKHTNEELLVGGRNMSILPVAASVMVTYLSAVTIIGFPSEVYAYGAQIFMYHLAASVGVPLSAFLLIPFFYPMRLTSVNEYLEKRFQSKWVRWLGSGIFIFQQTVLASVYLYAPSLALEAFMGIPMWMSILSVGFCATIYTNVGGIKAVVWTDAFQCIIMIGSMIVICWRGISRSGGVVTAFQLASERGRLKVFDWTFDPFSRHNFWNFMIGTGFHFTMQPGIHQLQVQRYCGMPTLAKAKHAVIGSVPLKMVIISLCLLTGFSIFAFYENLRCDPYTAGQIKKVDQVVPYFVVNELTDIPGMMGIFTACIFSAVLSSLSSSLNSLAAVTWEDFLVRHKTFGSMSPQAQTNITRLIGVVYGIISMILAFSAKNLDAVYSVTIVVVGCCAGALYGVFLMAMFFPFVNAVGALVGTLTGFLCILTLSLTAYLNKKAGESMLAFSVEECPANTNATFTATPMPFPGGGNTQFTTEDNFDFSEWPWKVFRLSYLLYAAAAAVIAITVGIIASAFACICSPYYRKRKPLLSLLHPLVQPICKCCAINDKTNFRDWEDGDGIKLKQCRQL